MKNLTKHTFSILALLSVTACHFEPADPIRMPTDAEVEQYNASVPPEEKIVCREETPVDTFIPRRICRYVTEMDQESRFHRSELIRAIR